MPSSSSPSSAFAEQQASANLSSLSLAHRQRMATISTIQSLDPEPDVGPGSRIHARAHVSAKSVTALLLRVRALVQEWIDEDTCGCVDDVEGLINEEAITTFVECGGDLADAVPYALLEARKLIVKQGDDGGEQDSVNEIRALACELLAKGVVKRLEAPLSLEGGSHHHNHPTTERQSNSTSHSHVCLSKRFVQFDEDGDCAQPTSALESAVDQGCTTFLAAPEAQRCAEELWNGQIVQTYSSSGSTVYFESYNTQGASFFSKMDPSRLSVPKYAYYANLVVHMAFIVIYTFSTLEYTGLDVWEIILWIFAAGYLIEDVARWIKLGGMDKIISFWVVIDLAADVLFLTAFAFRVIGWLERSDAKSAHFRLLAFQFLACIAPLLWMQLLKLADGLQYFGVIQIVLLRMLQETAAFFLLLLITAVGFAQSFFALDASDSHRVENSASFIINLLVAGMLGQPDLDAPSDKFGAPFGKILFYFYVFITVMLLANILVAFFASAYDKTVDAADDVFKAYFCSKVVSSVRAPDNFVYYVPLNLLEFFFIAPFEYILPRKAYVKINYYIQSLLFFPALVTIAFYESDWSGSRAQRLYLDMVYDMPEERVRRLASVAGIENVKDPQISASPNDDDDASEVSVAELATQEPVIARRAFKELAAQLPSRSGKSTSSQDASKDSSAPAVTAADLSAILSELKALREEVAKLKK